MFNLFQMETVLQEEVLISKENNLQRVLIRVNESSGNFPYIVTLENVSNDKTSGRQTHSFHQMEQAEEKFAHFIESYKESGYCVALAS